jgi:hypothetical protein
LAIFGEKCFFFFKNQRKKQFYDQNFALFGFLSSQKTTIFSPIFFGENYFKNHNIGPYGHFTAPSVKRVSKAVVERGSHGDGGAAV